MSNLVIKAFDQVKVKLLKTFDRDEEGDNYYQVGDVVEAHYMPTNCFYLCDGDCFETNAKEGIDFEFIFPLEVKNPLTS